MFRTAVLAVKSRALNPTHVDVHAQACDKAGFIRAALFTETTEPKTHTRDPHLSSLPAPTLSYSASRRGTAEPVSCKNGPMLAHLAPAGERDKISGAEIHGRVLVPVGRAFTDTPQDVFAKAVKVPPV